MVADIDSLKAVRDSRLSSVTDIGPCDGAPEVLISTGEGQAFRATRGFVHWAEDQLRISPELAQTLKLQIGDQVRHVEF